MKAGKLRNLIVIQARDSGTDDAGQPVQTWTTLGTVWANVKTATGLTSIRAGLSGVEVNGYSFEIRFTTAYDAADRVVFNSQNFDVKAVKHDFAGREWTHIIAEVGGNDG